MSDQFYSVDDYERELAKRWGIPEGLVRAMTVQESSRNDAAVGPDTGKGRGPARGRYQLLEGTAKELGVKNINDPFENVYGGLKYLKQGYEKASPHFRDDASKWGAALTYYHAGPSGLEQAIKTGEVPNWKDAANMTTRKHVRKIMNAWAADDDSGDTEDQATATPQQTMGSQPAQQQAPAPQPVRRPISTAKGPISGSQPQPRRVDWWKVIGPQAAPSPITDTAQKPVSSTPGTVQKPAPPMPTENPEVIKERARLEAMGPLQKFASDVWSGISNEGIAGYLRRLSNATPYAPVTGVLPEGRKAITEGLRKLAQQQEAEAGARSAADPSFMGQLGRGAGQLVADLPYYAASAIGGIPGVMAASAASQDWRDKPLEGAVETATAGLGVGASRVATRLANPLIDRLRSSAIREGTRAATSAATGGAIEAGQELASAIAGGDTSNLVQRLGVAGILGGATSATDFASSRQRRTPRAADPKAQEIVDAVRPQAEAEPEVQAPAQRPAQPTRQSPVAPQQEGAAPTAPPAPAALTPPEAPTVPRGLQFFYGNEPMDAIAEDNWGSYTVQVPNAEGDLEPVVVGWDKSVHGERPSRVVQEEAQQAATAYAQARRAEAAAAAQAAMAPPQAAPVVPEVGVEPAPQVAPQNTLDALRDALVRRPARAPNTPPMTPLPVTQGVAPQGLVDVPAAPEVDVESDIEPEIAPEPVTTYLPPTDPIRQMVATVAEQTGLEGRPLYQAVLKQMEAAPDDDTATSIFKAVFRREVAPQERTIPTVEPAPLSPAAPQDAAAPLPGRTKKMSEPRTPEELARIDEYFERPETPVEERERVADLIDAPTGKAEVPADMLRSGPPEFDLTPPPPERVKGEAGAYSAALFRRQPTIDDAGNIGEIPAFYASPKVKKALYLDERASMKDVHTRLRQAMAAYKQVPVEDYSLSTATREDFENFAKRNDLGPGTVEWESLQAALNTGQAKIDAAKAKTAEKQARLDAEMGRKADAAARAEQRRRKREMQKGKPRVPDTDLTLYGFIVRQGGIRPSKANRGETRWLSESGNKLRMFSKTSKHSLDEMRAMARESGFGEFETEADFLTALEQADKIRSFERSQRAIDAQLEKEWQEYIEKNWGDEDLEFSVNRPVVDIPVAGLAEKRGNVWGTERVDLANAPAEQVQEDVLSNAKSEYRAKPNRQGVLWGNHQASLMLYGALRNMGANVVPFNGARLTVGTARRAADMLLDSDMPAARELGDALANAAQDAAARGGRSVVFVDSTAPNDAGRASLRKTVGLVRHEFFHVGVGDADARMTMGVRWAEDSDASRVGKALRKAGYPNDVAILEEESIAHIVEGAWREIGFDNEQQAVNYLKRAFKRLIQANGLDKFEKMTMRVGPVAGRVAKDAKTETITETSAQSVGANQGVAGTATAGRPGGAVQQPQGSIRPGDAVGRVQEGGRDAGTGVQAAIGDQAPSQQQERAVAGLGRQPAPTYFSALERFVEKLPEGRVNAAQLLSQLDKPQSGVKQDELKWTGLKPWLTDNAGKPITKKDVMDFVKQNQVQVEIIAQGELPRTPAEKARLEASKVAMSAMSTELMLAADDRRRAGRPTFRDWLDQGTPESQASELLGMPPDAVSDLLDVIRIPEPARQRVIDAYNKHRPAWLAEQMAMPHRDPSYVGYTAGDGSTYHELVFTLPNIEGPKPKHFQEIGGNQVAHGRAKEIKVDGKRVYNVVEEQSDWHQAALEKDPETGERRGYRGYLEERQVRRRIADAKDRYDTANRRLLHIYDTAETEGKTLFTDQEWATVQELNKEIESTRLEWKQAERQLRDLLDKSVPEAPFSKNWSELVFKKMLRVAAENNFDMLAWDAGVVHLDRYPELSTIATGLEYYPDAGRLITYHPQDGRRYWTVNKAQTLTDLVGEEMAERLMASPARSLVSPPQKRYAMSVPAGTRVGGRGMLKFYDEILVNAINKYVKQWGVKVRPIERKLPNGKTHSMWAIDITPQMRDSVVYEGQPLFKTAAKVLDPDGTERDVMLAAAGPGPNVTAQLQQQANQPLPVQPPLPGMKPASKARWDDYVNTVQTAAQLLNPRFALRNIIGHLALASVETPTHAMAAVLDAVYSKVTGEPRQIAQLGLKEAKAFGRGAMKTGFQQSLKNKERGLSWGGEKLVDPPKALKPLADALWGINQLPDDMMFHGYYAAALDNLGKIYQGKRLKGVTPEMLHNQALAEANKAALRDKNFISNRLGQLKRALNKGTTGLFFENPKWGFGDLVVKYTQIPGALLKRGLEYTPLGFFDAAREFGALDFAFKTKKKGDPFRRRNTFLALSRAFNGSAGIAAAVVLGYAGALLPEEDEGKEQSELDREQGIQPYALNVSAASRFISRIQADGIDGAWRAGVHKPQDGDLMVSIDWLQPWGMVAGIGGNIGAALQDISEAKATQAAKNVGSVLMSSVDGVMSAMADQSVLKSLSRYLTNERASFGQALLYTAQDLPSSFTPQILNQLRQAIDPTVQDPRVRGEGVKGWLKEMFITKPLSRSVPGVLPPKLDTFGKPIKRPTDEMRDAGAGRWVNAFVKPYVTTRFRTNPISQAMRQADKVAGSPRFQPGSEKGPGETPEQWRERVQVKGQLLEKAGNAMAESYAYKQAPAEIQKRMTEVFLKRLSGGGSLHPGSIHSEARSQALKEAREKVLGITSPQKTLKQQKRMLDRFQ